MSDAFERARRRLTETLSARRAETLAALLLVLMSATLLSIIWRKTITNDEIVHIPAGYYHLVAGEFQLNNEHPPLIKMWAALPQLFIQPEEPPPATTPGNSMERTWNFHSLYWQANAANFQALSFWTRVMMLPLTFALGALIFIYARRLFGERAALFAVVLYVFEPTVLAHGRVVHTDIPAALVYLLFFFALHAYAVAPTLRRACLVGLASGIALVTKFSMVVIIPILFAAAAFYIWTAPRRGEQRKTAGVHASLAALVILFVINAAYYFQSQPLEESDVRWVALKSAPRFDVIIAGIGVLSKILPTYYLFGIYNVAIHNQYGHAASLLGMQSDLGWWYYFPIAFALKTTLPFLLLSIVALLWAFQRLVFKRESIFIFLLVPFAAYTALSLTSHINIGVRHFLPVFPFLFILGGALLDRLVSGERMRRAALALVCAIFVWVGFEAVRTYPDYIPYMNQLASAQPRWHYLSDSNVEWGDDVPELAAYLRARGETRVRAALSGGWSTLRFYGIEHLNLFAPPGEPLPETRYVAIGASFLNGSTVPGDERIPGLRFNERTNFFARYRTRQPEAVFGHSIYLFREETPNAER